MDSRRGGEARLGVCGVGLGSFNERFALLAIVAESCARDIGLTTQLYCRNKGSHMTRLPLLVGVTPPEEGEA